MNDGKSTVALTGCNDYGLPLVRKAVADCVDRLPDLQEKCTNADTVLVKPNLLSSREPPEKHVNTHPSVARALCETLTGDFGCRVFIGDSCGSLSPSSTERAISNSRIDAVARATDAEIYNVDSQPRQSVPAAHGRVLSEVMIPSNLQDFDLIISLPKLKTHQLTYITCAVKNLLGLVPGAGKKQAHILAPRGTKFASLLCDLFALIQPGVALVDGVVGMEGAGPNNGTLREMGVIGASTDCSALDSVMARIMNMEPTRIPLLREAAERDLGTVDADSIEVIGAPMARFAAPDFKKPAAYANDLMLRLLPTSAARTVLEGFSRVHASIDQERCRRCGECARNCPSGAINYLDEREQYRVNPDDCISCFCCDEVCPFDAIIMKKPPFRRAIDCAMEFFGMGSARGARRP